MEAAAAFPEKSPEGATSVEPTPVAGGGYPESATCECE
jgi:hypothetical protein